MRSSIQPSTFFMSNDRVRTLGTRTGVARHQNHITDLVMWLAAITLLVVFGFSGQTRAATDIRTAKDPVIVSLPLPSAQGLLGATQDRRAQMAQNLAVLVAETIEENPGRLVTINPGRGKLAFNTLPAQEQAVAFVLNGDDTPALYEQAMAQLLDATFEALTVTHPNAPVSVHGLPLEARRWQPASIEDSNDRYQAVIDRLAAFAPSRSFILFWSSETEQHTVQRGLPEAFRLRDDRPIIFRTNDYWRILLGGSTDISDVDADGWHVVDSNEQDGGSSADDAALDSGDELALNEVAEDREDSDSMAEHDPFADPSDEDSSNGENADAGVPSLLSAGIGGGGGRARRSGRFGGGGGGSSGGGGGGGGGTEAGGGGGGGGGPGGGSDDGDGDGDGGGGDDSTWNPGDEVDGNPAGDPPGGGGGPGGGSDDGSGDGDGDGGDDSTWNPGDEVDGNPGGDPPGGGGGPGGGSDGGNDDNVPPDAAPVIPAGGGFSGPTNEPGPIGNPNDPGYDAKVIAHWDVVPYQTFNGDFGIGVVAFHMNGIDRVEFSAEGGSWTPVSEMTLNPRTNVWEYWGVLRAEDFDDGQVEVRAIAYPTIGEPRLLSYNHEFTGGGEEFSLWLSANANGTLPSEVRYVNPGESIAAAAMSIAADQNGNAGGGIIYLNPGDHAMQNSNVTITDRWLTIAGAPGTTVDQVRITGTGQGFSNGLLRVKGVTLRSPGFGGFGGNGNAGLWLEGISMEGTSPDDSARYVTNWINWEDGTYVTESNFTDLGTPLIRVHLMRNLVMDDIGGDLLRDPRFVVNVVAHRMGFDTGDVHSDFLQWYTPGMEYLENFIFYNVASYNAHPITQGIYEDGNYGGDNYTHNDVAFVNVHIDRTQPCDSCIGQWRDVNTNHLLLWNITHHNIDFVLISSDVTNLSVRGCSWDAFRMPPGIAPESAFRDNHYVDCTEWQAFCGGEGATTGDPGYVDPDQNDFRPGPGSPLLDRFNEPLARADANGVERSTTDSPASDVGAFEHQ